MPGSSVSYQTKTCGMLRNVSKGLVPQLATSRSAICCCLPLTVLSNGGQGVSITYKFIRHRASGHDVECLRGPCCPKGSD